MKPLQILAKLQIQIVNEELEEFKHRLLNLYHPPLDIETMQILLSVMNMTEVKTAIESAYIKGCSVGRMVKILDPGQGES